MADQLTYLDTELIDEIIKNALIEDVGPGDYSTLATIDENSQGEASIIIKGHGILAGVEAVRRAFAVVDDKLQVRTLVADGDIVKPGDIAISIVGSIQSILSAERLVLNILQRMSGIATKTHKIVALIKGTKAKLLDTRKTTPNFRVFEKWAVKIGGGHNHRFALYDMIMLKDNHIDFSGGIPLAVNRTRKYLEVNKLNLKIEVETRTQDEVEEAVDAGVDRILLDNMSTEELHKAVLFIADRCKTEASGGIDESNIQDVAKTGVDYISVGGLTHSYQSLDISLKASVNK
jgi:nicotinate-nucleotide pyrophosphorylase (carboxylating)